MHFSNLAEFFSNILDTAGSILRHVTERRTENSDGGHAAPDTTA
ncbi:hypothetical protein A0123_01797 [Gluconobacter cerinus]|uniref:Uncharacterized protein n=1 Tax=Gluconobacter cerinus TaxID=38307 RepID=A0A1B6VKK5_9PROT|nr:hypothetical protein A0123_01797 [Gluconobacter cerinus]